MDAGSTREDDDMGAGVKDGDASQGAWPQPGAGLESANDALRFAVVAAMAQGKGIDAGAAQEANQTVVDVAQKVRGSASRSPRREHVAKQVAKIEDSRATR